jgi:tRNA nucleotidyltransferase/poly(A) polymerase
MSSVIKTYLVGGAVRDHLLNIQSNDLDYVILGFDNYSDFRNYVISLGVDIKVDTPEYGVIRGVHPRLGGIDFAMPRKDENHDGRHADVVFVNTIEEDLARRDFTMNAMAIEVDHNLELTDILIDPFNGREDISNRLLRFVGKPIDRIKEDELRVLRALRFSLTKNLSYEHETFNAITNYCISNKVSNERIMSELNKMFACGNTSTIEILIEMKQLYLLDRIKFKITT